MKENPTRPKLGEEREGESHPVFKIISIMYNMDILHSFLFLK